MKFKQIFKLSFSLPGKVLLILLLFLICSAETYSNQETYLNELNNDFVHRSDSTAQKDVYDVIEKIFKYKVRSKPDSLIKRFVAPMPAVGYAIVSGFTAVLATNVSFYTDSVKNQFSSVLANAFYSQYNQYWFTVNSNIFYNKRKLFFNNDWRFYKYPVETYGISTTNINLSPLAIDFNYLRLYQILYREIRPDFFIGGGYHLDYHFNISTGGVTTGTVYEEMQRYDSKGDYSVSSGVSVDFLYDNRKNSRNPQGGLYAMLQYRPNFIFLGSDKNWQSMHIDARYYLKFPSQSNNILAFWSYNALTLTGRPPYLDMPSIGWDDYSNSGRGYVQGRFIGRNMSYLETEYRFPLIPSGLLGGVIFGNAESFYKRYENSLNLIIPGVGFGIRLKMEKHSNINIAIDYGFGIEGSHGFAFNLGEVF